MKNIREKYPCKYPRVLLLSENVRECLVEITPKALANFSPAVGA